MKQTKAFTFMALLLLSGAASATHFRSAASPITAPEAHLSDTATRQEKPNESNKEERTRKYEVGTFDKIKCATIANLYLSQGNETSVEARLHEGSLDVLDVSVEDGCLTIQTVSGKRYQNHYSVGSNNKTYFGDLDGSHSLQQEVDIYITTPSVSLIDLNGASRLTAKELHVDKLKIKVSSISAITLQNLVCNDTQIDLAGAYSCNINATGDRLTFDGSGVGKAKLKFKGGKLTLSNSGASTVKAEVDCQELHAENAGVGKITFKGTADYTNIESSGASKIDTKQLNQY